MCLELHIKAPSTKISPLCCSSTPAIMRNVVDFPHPDGPSRHVTWPGCNSIETSSTAVVSANLRDKFLIFSLGSDNSLNLYLQKHSDLCNLANVN